MTALRLAIALCAACAALFGGAWAGGAFARPGPAPRAQAATPYAHEAQSEIAVGDGLVVSGQPMQLSLFYTSDAPDKVVAFYADAFQARGVMPIVIGDKNMAHVSGFDPRDSVQRFISAVPQPDGTTMVMIGLTNPRKPPRLLRGAQTAGFPVPPENRAFMGFRSDDAGAHAESGQFVSSLSPAQVAAFYREKLPAQGYAESKPDSTESMLVFRKQGATLSVALQKLEEKSGAAVFVNRVEGDPR
jgi:hypothetical protein